jgi:hypothetical protein
VLFGVVAFFTCNFVSNFLKNIVSPPAKKEGLLEKPKITA